MKLLHKSGEVSKKAEKDWYTHQTVLIADDEYLKEDYVVTIFGYTDGQNDDVYISEYVFPKLPTDNQIMYCLRKAENDYNHKYYNLNASVDKRFRIDSNF